MNASPTERWAAKSFRDIRDYSLLGSPVWLQERVQGVFRDAMVQRIAARRAGLPKYRRAFDLCCGVGDWTLQYLSLAERVVGVDVNDSFLEQARARCVRQGKSEGVSFQQAKLQAWTDYENVGFVALGACLMYLDELELDAVLSRIAKALPSDGMLYVRASVVTRFRAPFENGEGHYRERSWYEGRFAKHRFAIVEALPSAQVVVDGLLHPVPWTGALRTTISEIAHAERVVRQQVDYLNWTLVPAS